MFLAHGDLKYQNVLQNNQEGVLNVIDWEDSRMTNILGLELEIGNFLGLCCNRIIENAPTNLISQDNESLLIDSLVCNFPELCPKLILVCKIIARFAVLQHRWFSNKNIKIEEKKLEIESFLSEIENLMFD